MKETVDFQKYKCQNMFFKTKEATSKLLHITRVELTNVQNVPAELLLREILQRLVYVIIHIERKLIVT